MAAPGAPLPLSAQVRAAQFREPHPQTGFKRHLHEHARPTCPKCKWGRSRTDWERATQVHACCRKSWIEVKPVTAERWALGCWVCRLASHIKDCTAPGHFGTCTVRTPKKSQLVKHHNSRRHKRSVTLFLQLRGLDAAGDSLAAPSVEEFAKLLQRIRRSELESPRRGSIRKYTTMAWCLYEAHREVERGVLAKAVCVSLVQDASTRGPLLLTRYVACGPLLQRFSGIMRIVRAGKHSGAQHLAGAVLGSIRAMATKRRTHCCMY